MFLNNKYAKSYYFIVNRAKNRTLTTYTERHHIVPKSLGGDNSAENLVKLTPKEHYVCHRLLTKMTEGNDRTKMLCAAMIMMHGIDVERTYRITSTAYSFTKNERAKAMSKLKKGKPGHPRSPETRAKMRAAKLGKKLSEETKLKMKVAATGRTHSDATKEKFKNRVNNRLGTKHSEETKLKMSLAKSR
jgi:hypothetical protein